jgi:tripartite-type tricarboxylate transporter receptor subunit TctC
MKIKMNALQRSWLTCALVASFLVIFSGASLAQQSKIVRVVVPFPPSGNLDTIARSIAPYLSRDNRAVVVENRAGANGNIGAENVYSSPPDGSALLFAPYGPIAVNQSLYPNLRYDPSQWVPITMLGTVPNVLAIHPSLPVHNVQEFITYLKANPGKVAFASQGSGSSSHLAAELFMQLTGTHMIHVPYKGTGPALTDLLGGQVTVFFDTLSSSGRFYKSGKLKILAVADVKRSALLPNVPTFAEGGPPALKQMISSAWYAAVAPPKTPPTIVSSYERTIRDALATPELRKKFAEMGISSFDTNSEQAGEFIRKETEKWAEVIRNGKVGKITVD